MSINEWSRSDRWKKFKPTKEVLHKHPKAKKETRVDTSLPQRPCISVNTSEGGLGGGHARIYIAGGNPLRHYHTDLQGSNHKPALIVFNDVTEWPHPATSQTFWISPIRAQNAIAVAKQFTRIQKPWVQTTDSLEEKAHKEELEALADEAKTRQEEGGVDWGKVGEESPVKDFHVPYKYGKFGTFLGKLNPSRSKYETCASYAEKILKAAGVMTPSGVFIQTPANLVFHKWLMTVNKQLRPTWEQKLLVVEKTMTAVPESTAKSITAQLTKQKTKTDKKGNVKKDYVWIVTESEIQAAIDEWTKTRERIVPTEKQLYDKTLALRKRHGKWSSKDIRGALRAGLGWRVNVPRVDNALKTLKVNRQKALEAMLTGSQGGRDDVILLRMQKEWGSDVKMADVTNARAALKNRKPTGKAPPKDLERALQNLSEKYENKPESFLVQKLGETRKWKVTEKEVMEVCARMRYRVYPAKTMEETFGKPWMKKNGFAK